MDLLAAWILLVVAILIAVAIIALVIRMGRNRKVKADRVKAQHLREEEGRTRLQASEHEADAAATDAKARQARVEAEKLEHEAQAQARDAEEARTRAEEHHQRAVKLDPNSDGSGNNRLQRDDDDESRGADGIERDHRS